MNFCNREQAVGCSRLKAMPGVKDFLAMNLFQYVFRGGGSHTFSGIFFETRKEEFCNKIMPYYRKLTN